MCGVRVVVACGCVRVCVVCCASLLKWLCVCAESVCGMCVSCFGVAVCSVWCVVSVVCGVCGVCCVLSVCGAAWHAEKQLRVKVQNASVCTSKTRACVQHARVLPLFLSSFILFLLLFSSLSVTMTMTTRPVGSLCLHTGLTCDCDAVRVLRSIPCLANMFT